MSTRNVVLTEYHDKVIDKLVRSGKYQNASEVIREGVRLIHEREKTEAAKLKAVREAVRLGTDALDRGDYVEFESMDALGKYLDDLTDKIIRGTGE